MLFLTTIILKMNTVLEKQKIARQLQARINAIQGLGKPSSDQPIAGLMPFATAFPGHVFPNSAIHEFISYETADAASTNGFITALMGKFMKTGGLCLWIGNERKIFPSALKQFGMEPDRIIFIKVPKPKDALWTIEEALKCEALTAVVAEIKELGFTESRRLQLAIEQSGITGFIHRFQPLSENATACTTRWKVTSIESLSSENLPGIGHSCWNVALLKVRNGKPDAWQVSWLNQQFFSLEHKVNTIPTHQERNAG